MWKAVAGTQISLKDQEADDDWETDPDFVNDVNEQQQRWGSTTVEGSGRTAGAINMEQLRKETEEADALKKKQQLIEGPNPSFGYGGKFGVQKDRMDPSAVGHDYVAKVEKHVSQKDYSAGFGGKFGVQVDRVDKSAVSWEYKEKVEKHASQKDYSSGFGGKFGVQTDRQDKSAVGWDHVEKVDKHESQKDYSKGFGGKFGVQTDRQDKSAVGWDHHEAPQKHESQIDHKKGFGGKFGVQTDRMDKSAVAFSDGSEKVGTVYTKTKPDVGFVKPSDIKAKFENMSVQDNISETTSCVSPRKNVLAKANIFNSQNVQSAVSVPEQIPKQLDQSKTAFLNQTNQPPSNEHVPGQLNQSKIAQFSENKTSASGNSQVKEELEQLKQLRQQQHNQVNEEENQEVYENAEGILNKDMHETREEKVELVTEEMQETIQEYELVDTGYSAVALYDYEAAADDEISFDPDDIITHVEMIDEGWWRGLCKGKHGLFPANYVQLQQ